MNEEKLNIFNRDMEKLGVSTRSQVHRLGYWHEVFSCWFISQENGVDYIVMQIRSQSKNDYPSLIDVAVAGHLLYNESAQDGVREIREEVGLEVDFKELIDLGTIAYTIEKDKFVDREIAQSFLYKFDKSLDDFALQKEELAGIVKIRLKDLDDLWSEAKDSIEARGFMLKERNGKIDIKMQVERNSFVPYGSGFYKEIIKRIKEAV